MKHYSDKYSQRPVNYGVVGSYSEPGCTETQELRNVRFRDVIGMATYTSDIEMVKSEFQSLKNIFNLVKNLVLVDASDFKELSMGMSSDFEIAIS